MNWQAKLCGQPPRRQAALQRHRAGGWNLLELMVALVIIGLILGIVGPAAMQRLASGQRSTAEVQVKQLRAALDTYKLDIGQYPSTAQGLGALTAAPPEVAEYWNGPYLRDELPADPWRAPYQYQFPANTPQGFALYSLGADSSPGGEGDDEDIGYLPDAG